MFGKIDTLLSRFYRFLKHCNFFAIGSFLIILDVLNRSLHQVFTSRTSCAITADCSRLWDSNRPTKKENRKTENFENFDFYRHFQNVRFSDFPDFFFFMWSVVPSAVSLVRLCTVNIGVCTAFVRVIVRLILGMGKSNRYRAVGVRLARGWRWLDWTSDPAKLGGGPDGRRHPRGDGPLS